jgi:hypothetical protein
VKRCILIEAPAKIPEHLRNPFVVATAPDKLSPRDKLELFRYGAEWDDLHRYVRGAQEDDALKSLHSLQFNRGGRAILRVGLGPCAGEPTLVGSLDLNMLREEEDQITEQHLDWFLKGLTVTCSAALLYIFLSKR